MNPGLDRRTVLAGAAAALGFPRRTRAQPARFSRTADAARDFDQLHAIIVAEDGTPALAEAFRGPALDRPVNVKSVAKTVVAALTGAAIDRGVVPGLDATLGDLIPDLIPADADPRVVRLTLADLVTMQAGLARTSGANYGAWVSSRDWVGYALAQPFVADPGERMLYSTGSFHVLGAALAHASGDSLLTLARDWLGDPLDIEIPTWTRDPQGFYLGGNEMALSPFAMLAFGEMYRRHGRAADGATVLSRDWVESSFVPRTRSPFSGLDYGYGWFLGRRAGRRVALARGYGGQLIVLVPELALTVVVTSDPTRPARSEGYFGELMDLVAGTLIPEVEAA
jgi:CubicO group peptidase (beta-lactamase class C family)